MVYLKGLQSQADLSLKIAREIDGLLKMYRSVLEKESAHIQLYRVLEFCFVQPYVTAPLATRRLNIPAQTVRRYSGKQVNATSLKMIEIFIRTRFECTLSYLYLLLLHYEEIKNQLCFVFNRCRPV